MECVHVFLDLCISSQAQNQLQILEMTLLLFPSKSYQALYLDGGSFLHEEILWGKKGSD